MQIVARMVKAAKVMLDDGLVAWRTSVIDTATGTRFRCSWSLCLIIHLRNGQAEQINLFRRMFLVRRLLISAMLVCVWLHVIAPSTVRQQANKTTRLTCARFRSQIAR